MTNPTPHGQVPEALIDLIDAYAETRHRYGRIHNARTGAARKAVIEDLREALSGVQALSAAPAIAKLRHLYQNMVNGAVRDTASAKRIAEGLLAPAIEALERATPPAEQQSAPKAAPGVGNSGFDHQTAADFLSGKTVSDEAVRKFVQASRWAHDERAALSATLLAMHGVLTSREAEIAHLKKALLEAETAPQPAPHLPERDARLPAERQGLFRKFVVGRVDGSDKPGGKHHGCTYFVLDVDHDPCARPALAAYAAACESTHPTLAADLRTKWGVVPAPQPAPAPLSESIDRLGRELAIIGVVGAIDGYDVVRRESVLEIARRAAIAAQGGKV